MVWRSSSSAVAADQQGLGLCEQGLGGRRRVHARLGPAEVGPGHDPPTGRLPHVQPGREDDAVQQPSVWARVHEQARRACSWTW